MNTNNNYQYLRDKWIKKHQDLQIKISKKHNDVFKRLSENSKQLAVGSLSGLLLLSSPIQKDAHSYQPKTEQSSDKIDNRTFLISDLYELLPKEVRPLNPDEEEKIAGILTNEFGVTATSSLNGFRLNRSYGLIGAEQHLARFPGDNMATHFDNPKESSKFSSSGIAPGLGAWGYFATSASQMTKEDEMREKYYIAVQTFLAPDFNSRIAEYRDFFKFRKMLVVNPQNGKAVIAVIGDAGPGVSTGKHLGGSPEVMEYLERFDGSARGPVIYYFLDDPNDKIPLGPIEPIKL